MDGTEKLRGMAVYMFAFDVAYELDKMPVKELFGQKAEVFRIDPGRRSPKYSSFHHPQMVTLPPKTILGPDGQVTMKRMVKVLPIGAISIMVQVPFEVERLGDLVDYHDLNLGDSTLQDEVCRLARDTYLQLGPHMVRPAEYLADEEAYTVFCIESGCLMSSPDDRAEDWLTLNRRQVAGLLTQELDYNHLSEQETEESTSRYLSYYYNDIVVMDWDAALIVDEPGDFAESLYIMELANLHLSELEAYDRLIDRALERAYRDLRESKWRTRNDLLVELREIRIDLARYNDALSNITKFLGDWHLARMYEIMSARFHLSDWNRNVNVKLKTVDSLYELLQHSQNNRWMLILEGTIVLLFIIDLVAIFWSK